MDLLEKVDILGDVLSLRCDRCENSTCGHYDVDPVSGMFSAVNGDYVPEYARDSAMQNIIDWASHGFCAFEAAEWKNLGVSSAEIAHNLLKSGVSLFKLRCIIDRAVRNRQTSEKSKKRKRGGISDEVRKRDKNIPQGTTK